MILVLICLSFLMILKYFYVFCYKFKNKIFYFILISLYLGIIGCIKIEVKL